MDTSSLPDELKRLDYRYVLGRYQDLVDVEIEEYLTSQEKGELLEACRFALAGGKRFRPALVYLVAQALGRAADVTGPALAVEFFHTASLVADDMPCMDNDGERRGKKALHCEYNETVALLTTYALIASGYHCLTMGRPVCGEDARLHAIRNVAHNTGISGATGGQHLDLFPPSDSIDSLQEVIRKKTVSLFEVAFVLGWIYGGGAMDKLDKVKRLSLHFGMAFQIADDLDDLVQDEANECKVNYALSLGKEKAHQQFVEEVRQYRHILKELAIATPELLALAIALERKVADVMQPSA